MDSRTLNAVEINVYIVDKHTLLIKTIFLKNKTYTEYLKRCSKANTYIFFLEAPLKSSKLIKERGALLVHLGRPIVCHKTR